MSDSMVLADAIEGFFEDFDDTEVLVRFNTALIKTGCKAVLEISDVCPDEPEKVRGVKLGFAFQSMKSSEVSVVTDGKEPACPICQEDFDPSDALLKYLSCKQTFHVDCLLTWTSDTERDSCPYCRRDIVETNSLSTMLSKASKAAEHRISLVEKALRKKIEGHEDPESVREDIANQYHAIVAKLNIYQLETLDMIMARADSSDNQDPANRISTLLGIDSFDDFELRSLDEIDFDVVRHEVEDMEEHLKELDTRLVSGQLSDSELTEYLEDWGIIADLADELEKRLGFTYDIEFSDDESDSDELSSYHQAMSRLKALVNRMEDISEIDNVEADDDGTWDTEFASPLSHTHLSTREEVEARTNRPPFWEAGHDWLRANFPMAPLRMQLDRPEDSETQTSSLTGGDAEVFESWTREWDGILGPEIDDGESRSSPAISFGRLRFPLPGAHVIRQVQSRQAPQVQSTNYSNVSEE